MYSCLIKIPILKDILLITNAYVWRGDVRFVSGFAPLRLWFSRLWSRVIVALVLLFVFYGETDCNYLGWMIVSVSDENVGHDLILSIFPNLLGFGLGVYALIFSLPGLLDKQGANSTVDVKPSNLLNADMGFPLLVMVVAICIALVSKLCNGRYVLAELSFFALVYGLLLLLELISLIFMGAAKVINK